MKRNPLPLVGVLVSLVLFVLAGSLYPGGYDWTRDFVSTLFAPSTATGEANTARYVAVVAMFVLCVSVAVIFKVVSVRARSRAHKKTLEIGGIGSAVYAFLVVTPMHDLLLGIALLFFFPAMGAALYLVRLEGRKALFWAGMMCLGLVIAAATMYYGNLFWHLLPIAQKVSLAACIGWLLTLQLATGRRAGADRCLAPSNAPSGTEGSELVRSPKEGT
jgi:hypothetical protein